MNKIHYFDYNASHPPLTKIIQEAWKEYSDEFYNPSGATRFSLGNQGKIEEARNFFAKETLFPSEGIVFSSTGTEANFLLVAAIRQRFPDVKEFITSSFEHASFFSALEFFHFEPKILKTDFTGIISLTHLEEILKQSPLPTGIIYAGNETGVIQPMEEVSHLVRSYGMPLVSDCMQAFGKIFINYNLLDGMTCSGHKIGAGPGSGLTTVREILIHSKWQLPGGGNQENGHRAGSENLPSILSFRKLSEYQIERLGSQILPRIHMRTRIESKLKELGCEIVAENSPRLPNTIFTILPIEELDFLMMGLEEKSILISTGSSCKSRSREPAASLLSMGYSKDEALRAIRISFGSLTTNAEIDHLLISLETLLNQL